MGSVDPPADQGCKPDCRYERGDMPRQQLHDAIDRMLGDTLENIAQVGFRIELIELGRTDERVDNGRALTAAVSTGEEIIFSAESNRAKRAFRGIVVDLDSSIIAISCEGFPACEAVMDGARKV